MGARNTFAATRRSHSILKRLRQGEGVTIEEVSEEFDIQYPQARADLKLLEELYELNTFRRGRTKVWEMAGVNTKHAAVGIAAALELGAISLDVFKDTAYGEWIDAHCENWRNQVGEPHGERLRRFQTALMMRHTWLPAKPEELREALEEILDCISLRRGLKMDYERADGRVGTYQLIPRRVIWYQGRLWLQAIDLSAGEEEKLFDIAGIRDSRFIRRDKIISRYLKKSLKDNPLPPCHSEEEEEAHKEERRSTVTAKVDELFAYLSKEEEDRYFESAFGIYGSGFECQEVILLVQGPWANYFRRYRVHPSQHNEEQDQGLQVSFRIGICPEFRSFLLGMIPDVTIIGPSSLQKEISEAVAQWSEPV